MVKKIGLAALCFIFVFAIISASLASAEIIISQPQAVYSWGDELAATITIDSVKSGYLDVNLACGIGEENIYHDVPDSKTLSLKRTLIPLYIGANSGSCNLIAKYYGEIKTSQNFQIGNSIEIVLQIDKMNIEAGQKLLLKGTAYKNNGKAAGTGLEAFLEASMNNNITSSSVIKNGQFTVSFTVPETTHAGTYSLNIRAYDKDEQGNTLNVGEKTAEIAVSQKLAKIEIAVDKESLIPGEKITIIPFLYDKAGDKMTDSVLVKVIDSGLKSIFEGFVPANENSSIKTSQDYAPGLYNIIVQSGNMTAERAFEVQVLKKISTEIANETLIIKNAGNIDYNDIIEVQIGSETMLKEINLGVGEKTSFGVSAPNGEYTIVVKDKDSQAVYAGVMLTGKAISLEEIGEGLENIWFNYPIMWIFMVVVLALLAWVFYKKYKREQRFYPFNSSRRAAIQEARKKGGVEVVNQKEVMDKILDSSDIRRAEQVLVLHGQKQPVSIIAIKIKNDIKGIAKTSIDNALEIAYRKKAVSYGSGNNVILIFSPLLTKTFKNEYTAINCAREIENQLREHNRKFRNDLIRYGIGINSGDLINKLDGKILQFTSINKTITLAKKIAEMSNEEVLLSKEIHEKTMSSVKAEKMTGRALDTFAIKRVVNSEDSRKFIQEFLRRNTTK